MDMEQALQSGYMLFIRVLSKWWHKPEHELLKWGLKTEFDRPFLGISAKLWQMLTEMERNRWRQLTRDEYLQLLNDYVTIDSLILELTDHISSVLGSTLVSQKPDT